MRKKLLFVEINECDFNFIKDGSKKFNFTYIDNFLKKRNKIETYTNDKIEGFNLDPWVQWVSVHTGTDSSYHKTYRLGQTLDRKIPQTWDLLSKKKIYCGVWGAFNATFRKNKNLKLFFPDPWSFKEKAYPNNLNLLLSLPGYYSQNYPDINLKKIIINLAKFFSFICLRSVFPFFVSRLNKVIKILLLGKMKSMNLYFFLELINLLILKQKVKQNKLEFLIVAFNSFAHYQHNYWDEVNYHYIYFWFLNEKLKLISDIEKKFDETLIFNGFGQYKTKTIYTLRPQNPEKFIENLNIKYSEVRQNMTTGATIFFKNYKNKKDAINILKSYNLYKFPLFYVENYKNKKKIFYKFALEAYNNPVDINKISKLNYKLKFNLTNGKILKKNTIDKKKLKKIFENLLYTKSTSKHVSDGILYTNQILKNKKKIKNTLIHNEIIKFFQKKSFN